MNEQKNHQNTIETRHVRLIGKDESQAGQSEHESCNKTFADVLTDDTPGHERDRFLMTVFIDGTAWMTKDRMGYSRRTFSFTNQYCVIRRWCQRSYWQWPENKRWGNRREHYSRRRDREEPSLKSKRLISRHVRFSPPITSKIYLHRGERQTSSRSVTNQKRVWSDTSIESKLSSPE